MSDKQGLESALHMHLATTGPKLIWSKVMNVCLHQSAVTFSDLSRNVLSARAGCDTALFFLLFANCIQPTWKTVIFLRHHLTHPGWILHNNWKTITPFHSKPFLHV